MKKIGKATKSFKLSGNTSFRSYKTLLCVHQFTAVGQTDIDLNTLVLPSSGYEGFNNPTPSEVQSAHILTIPQNVCVWSSSKGFLGKLSFDIITPSLIRLKNGIVSEANEIFEIKISQVPLSNLIAVESRWEPKTGVLAAGVTDIVTTVPFEYNATPTQQIGSVEVEIEGKGIFRCEGNNIANDGDYIEVAPTSGTLSNTIRLKSSFSVPVSYKVKPVGRNVYAPTLKVVSLIESLYAQMDKIILDLAEATGNPTTRYQSSPNSVDLSVFGEKVNAMLLETFYNCVVGSAAQVASGKATHSNLQTAITECPVKGKILLLDSYTGTENITINKLVNIEGKGNGSRIGGTFTLQAGFVYGTVRGVRFSENVTVDAGASYNFIKECFLATGKTFTDNGTGNEIQYMGE